MISFPCPHCGMKFQVKTHFAGRSSRCPTCKQPLIVPAPNQTVAVARGQIDGTPSSVARAKTDGESNRGKQSQSMDPSGPTSANEWQSPIIP